MWWEAACLHNGSGSKEAMDLIERVDCVVWRGWMGSGPGILLFLYKCHRFYLWLFVWFLVAAFSSRLRARQTWYVTCCKPPEVQHIQMPCTWIRVIPKTNAYCMGKGLKTALSRRTWRELALCTHSPESKIYNEHPEPCGQQHREGILSSALSAETHLEHCIHSWGPQCRKNVDLL